MGSRVARLAAIGAAMVTVGGLAVGPTGCGGSDFAAMDGGGGTEAGAEAGADTGSPGSPGDAGGSDGGVVSASDGGPARSFALASGGVQLVVSTPPLGLQITPANLGEDDDVLEIHQEFYGIPWQSFQAGNPPPAEWTAMMDSIAGAAKATGKPVFLSITPLNGGRDHLAARTYIDSGEVKSQDNWSSACYDFDSAPDAASIKQAYLRYEAWMIDEFAPRWLNVAVEANLFFEKCPSAVHGLVTMSNAAYDAAKAKNAAMVVFPSIQIDHLYGYSSDSCPSPAQRATCFDQAYAQIAPLKRDRFAMSTYPMLNQFQTPADLPIDWFTRGASRGGERPLIAETGWNSASIVVKPRAGACTTIFTGSEPDEAAYLGRVLDAAVSGNIELVNWWSDRDLLDARLMTDCPCTFDTTWCAVLDIFRGPANDAGPDTQLLGELTLKAFGVMGLRDYAGAKKTNVYARWAAARATPWKP
jgi:hypothetical protein